MVEKTCGSKGSSRSAGPSAFPRGGFDVRIGRLSNNCLTIRHATISHKPHAGAQVVQCSRQKFLERIVEVFEERSYQGSDGIVKCRIVYLAACLSVKHFTATRYRILHTNFADKDTCLAHFPRCTCNSPTDHPTRAI